MPAVEEVFLQPGDVFVGDARHRVRTLLGSCVSVVLWHPRRRVGAMCHFVVPGCGDAREGAAPGRYAEGALELMVTGLGAHGVEARACVVKLFGGAHMFKGCGPESEGVGRANGLAARDLLARRGLAVAAESLFGFSHRRIRFDVSTGEVWMWKGRPVTDPGGRREHA